MTKYVPIKTIQYELSKIRKRYQKYCEEYYKNKSQIIKKNSNKHNK